jgi:predicted DNA-binding transcriptional regulator YafY
VLRIEYHPFDSDFPIEFIIHPYHLRQYNNRWFLFGLNPEKGKYDWNLALDRIVKINETKIKYIKNDEIKWNEYFEDIIGVTKPSGMYPITILLHFVGSTGKYIESKPIHGSQKSRWLDSNTLEVKVHLIINYEFERLVLSYGEGVIVKYPDDFKVQIANRLAGAASMYEGSR